MWKATIEDVAKRSSAMNVKVGVPYRCDVETNHEAALSSRFAGVTSTPFEDSSPTFGEQVWRVLT
jgi:hypothetical protein